jgi:aminoglycoside phosphotransferase (APT) family kinase protein
VRWRSDLRGLLRHPDEPRVLLLRSGGVWRLPRVRAPEIWIADAAKVADAFERRLGSRPWLLRQVSFADLEEPSRVEGVLELELRDPAWRPPPHGRWADADAVGRLRVREADAAIAASYLRDLNRVPPERAPWAQPGWRQRAEAWIGEQAALLGRHVLAVEQVKHWSISAVLRVRTDGPELYLKAPARLPLFAEEAAVTAGLAERFPGHVPAPVAVEPDEGWLLLPAFDEVVGWEAPDEVRREAFARFGRLQRQTADAAGELLALGCLDRRPEVLAGQLPGLLADRRALSRLEPKERRALRAQLPAFVEACGRLAEAGPPPALVHGDLHLGNVARLDGRLVFFDWTDACVAHPFVDLQSLREEDGPVRDAYLEAWADTAPPARLAEAVELARVVRPLHHAVSYNTIVHALEPVAKPELDATHEFLRAALAAARRL